MNDKTEPLTVCITQSNMRAMEKARIAARKFPEIVAAALAGTDLNTVLLDTVNFTRAKKVTLKIDSESHRALKTIARERLCSVNLLINCAIAKYLHVGRENQDMVFEEISLDRKLYKRLQEVAKRRHVTIDLLLNSALMQLRPERKFKVRRSAGTRTSNVRRNNSA